jgi:hypothetical protein
VRIVLRIVAVVAAFTVLGTIWFVVRAPAVRDAILSVTSGAFGAFTLLGWVVSIVAGPIAAVQLWRLREIGRRAAIVVFGYGFAYYVVGLLIFRDPEAPLFPILLAVASFAIPLAIVLSKRARQVCSAHGRRP